MKYSGELEEGTLWPGKSAPLQKNGEGLHVTKSPSHHGTMIHDLLVLMKYWGSLSGGPCGL
eukprot:1743129-Karenia_brevis.AAC.1